MVRAPPCHGGSCGFEPRLPRILFTSVAFIILASFLFSCSSSSVNDFKHEGQAISRLLTEELKRIRSRDDLIEHSPRLRELFNRLADVVIRAQEYKDKNPEASLESASSHKEQNESDQLRVELNRILHMEGGREVIEKTQEEALSRLEAFEKARLNGDANSKFGLK